MSTTANALLLPVGGHLVALDLDADTQLLPTFQANDRTRPESIQNDYSAEFTVPGSAHNHRLLAHAASNQPAKGSAYVRLSCVLTSGGVETLPLGLLYLKGYAEGRYKLQLAGGNRRLVEALGDKNLSDLDLSRFDHLWTAHEINYRLGYAHWQNDGWGYELYERGKPLDLQALDPFLCYPSCSFALVLEQVIADAGFTANSLRAEAFYAALNVPSANPYTFPQAYRDARRLQAGYFYGAGTNYYHQSGFDAEKLNFSYVSQAPYHAPEASTGSTYFAGDFRPDTLGYYDVGASVACFWGCNESLPGKVRVKFMLKLNGQPFLDANGHEIGTDEAEAKGPTQHTFTPKLSRHLLQPTDVVSLWWEGTELNGASSKVWNIGPYGSQTALPGGQLSLANEVQLTATLLPEFPEGGVVKLAQWLPEMKQLDFLKTAMLLLGLTIQVDDYRPHLYLAPGSKLLANIPRALDWTSKRDAAARPGRLPERDLSYRFGSYGQLNYLRWAEDEHVTPGTGEGTIAVFDQVLPATNELATLPFAASEPSPVLAGLLRILNFTGTQQSDGTITYAAVEAKPRLTLRRPDGEISGNLVLTPADAAAGTPAELVPFLSTVSYFAGPVLSLDINNTVLTTYWADLRAMLDEARYLVERYRLTPADIAALEYTVPIYDAGLGDFFCVSKVEEYDSRRSVLVTLCRLNASHLPAPVVPGDGVEFYGEEFYGEEYY